MYCKGTFRHEQRAVAQAKGLENTLHTAQDFEKGDVKQFRKACQWYETLGQSMASSGHCLDVFACSLDQVGIAEMHDAVSVTGDLDMCACSAFRMLQVIRKQSDKTITCLVQAALASSGFAMLCSAFSVTASAHQWTEFSVQHYAHDLLQH